jgi:hypothetical protein
LPPVSRYHFHKLWTAKSLINDISTKVALFHGRVLWASHYKQPKKTAKEPPSRPRVAAGGTLIPPPPPPFPPLSPSPAAARGRGRSKPSRCRRRRGLLVPSRARNGAGCLLHGVGMVRPPGTMARQLSGVSRGDLERWLRGGRRGGWEARRRQRRSWRRPEAAARPALCGSLVASPRLDSRAWSGATLGSSEPEVAPLDPFAGSRPAVWGLLVRHE